VPWSGPHAPSTGSRGFIEQATSLAASEAHSTQQATSFAESKDRFEQRPTTFAASLTRFEQQHTSNRVNDACIMQCLRSRQWTEAYIYTLISPSSPSSSSAVPGAALHRHQAIVRPP
jgi:hypothetical protein